MSETVKPFAAFDVDGTIFKSSLLEKAIQVSVKRGLMRKRAFRESARMRREWQNDNTEGTYIAYTTSMVGAFVSQIAGVDCAEMDDVVKTMLKQHAVRKFKFPRQLARSLQDTHYTVALSGSPQFMIEPFLSGLPFRMVQGSTYKTKKGKFTDEAVGIGDKSLILRGLVDGSIACRAGSTALGDTMDDRSMLMYAERPAMFNASDNLTDFGIQFRCPMVDENKDRIKYLTYDERVNAYVMRKDMVPFVNQLRAAA